MDNRLDGKHVLIVEDDHFLAAEVHEALERMGALILGPVSSVETALDLVAIEPCDAAILDTNLDAGEALPIVDDLMQRAIPIARQSGRDGGDNLDEILVSRRM